MISHKPYDDIAESERLVREVEHKQLRIDSLLEITEAINRNIKTNELFEIYRQSLKAQFNYDKVNIIYKNDGKWEMYEEGGSIKKVDRASLDQLQAIDALTMLDNPLALGSFDVAVPVIHKSEPLAYILINGILNRIEGNIEEELRFIQTFSNVTLTAVENKRLFNTRVKQEVGSKEMELAVQVQSALVPTEFPETTYYKFAAEYIPFKGVGGDLFDVIPHPKERSIFFLVADVAGKGFSAAMLMANFQATIRSAINKDDDYVTFVQSLNKEVFKITKGERFITMFMAKLEFDNERLLYLNAGHNPAIYKRNREIVLLDKGTTVLGAMEKLPFVDMGIEKLVPNSTIFSYTDGLTDVMNEADERFKLEGLMHFLQKNSFEDPKELNQSLLTKLDIHKGEATYNDDITMLACRIGDF